MATSEGNGACEDAAAYYHDFLLDPGAPSIPRSVIDHMGQCEHCRQQVARLGRMLDETEAPGAPADVEADKSLIAELQRHFEHIGGHVGCAQVKPLLPTLLLSSLRIRIPTPVTVHVDHCPECIRDLATLRALALDDEQLARLSRFYAESLRADSQTCQGNPSKATILGSMSIEGVETDLLDHLCLCPACRDMVYEHRQGRLDRQRRDGQNVSDTCGHELSMAELFDYVVPYGRGRTDGTRPGREHDDMGAHVRSCPWCVEKVQALHRAVYGILDRVDSKVVTVYRTQAVGRDEPAPAGSLYAEHPIDVQVAGLEPEPATQGVCSGNRVRAVLRRATSNPVLNPFVKTAFLAAAMIPVAIVFWMNTRSASGLSVGQIGDMVANAPAVHLETVYATVAEPMEDLWISDDVVIWRDFRQHAVYDLAERRKLDVGFGADGKWVATDKHDLDQIRRAVNGRLAFVEARAKLRLAVGDDVSTADGGNEVYEIVWCDMDSRGAPVFRRQTVSLDPTTKRPRRVQFSTKIDGAWELEVTTRVTYPDPNEIAERAEALLGPQGAEAE